MLLRFAFEEEVDKLAKLYFGLPWSNPNFYKNWLSQQYFLVQHTPRLLCAWALRCSLKQKQEFNHILYHLKEETGHDQWLLNDLQKAGAHIESFKPHPFGEALIKSQYYQIQHEDPLSIFGYSQLLEHLSSVAAAQIADQVESNYGRGSAVFLRGHAHVDVQHAQDGWEALKNVPSESERSILQNLKTTSYLYEKLLIETKNLASENSQLHKAS